MFKIFTKVVVVLGTVFSLVIGGAGVASAGTKGVQSPAEHASAPTLLLSASQQAELNRQGVDSDLLCKLISVGKTLSFSPDGKNIITSLSDGELASRYGFKAEQISDFRAILGGSYKVSGGDNRTQGDSYLTPKAAARFYISFDMLTVGIASALFAAAEVGPAALAAAFTALATMIGGPIGTIVAGGVSLLGTAFFIDLGAKILGAVAQGKGVALYLQWGFPPIRSEIE